MNLEIGWYEAERDVRFCSALGASGRFSGSQPRRSTRLLADAREDTEAAGGKIMGGKPTLIPAPPPPGNSAHLESVTGRLLAPARRPHRVVDIGAAADLAGQCRAGMTRLERHRLRGDRHRWPVRGRRAAGAASSRDSAWRTFSLQRDCQGGVVKASAASRRPGL